MEILTSAHLDKLKMQVIFVTEISPMTGVLCLCSGVFQNINSPYSFTATSVKNQQIPGSTNLKLNFCHETLGEEKR